MVEYSKYSDHTHLHADVEAGAVGALGHGDSTSTSPSTTHILHETGCQSGGPPVACHNAPLHQHLESAPYVQLRAGTLDHGPPTLTRSCVHADMAARSAVASTVMFALEVGSPEPLQLAHAPLASYLQQWRQRKGNHINATNP